MSKNKLMETYCLLDANSLIKYYVDLSGSAVIKFLLDKSPSRIIYLTTIQAEEFISLIYQFRRANIIDSQEKLEIIKDTFFRDIQNKKFYLYDFVREHLIDFEVHVKITEIPPPRGFPLRFMPWHDGLLPILKDIADTGDSIMLKVFREIHFLRGGNCYLVTCNEHVERVAEALKLKVINPETDGVEDLPGELDVRRVKRKAIDIKVDCTDCELSSPLPVARTINISDDGVCIESKSPMAVGKKLSMAFSSYDSLKKTGNLEGKVMWCDPGLNRAGIRLLTPINSQLFFS